MKRIVGLVLLGILAFALATLFARLGFWQLGRLEQRRARNAAWTTALRQPEIVLDSARLERIAADPRRYVNRPVRAAGSYVAGADIVLRGRVYDGHPGVHLVTPLRINGTRRLVLVNRGWVPSPDAASIEAWRFAEPGPRTVRGVFQLVPVTENGGQPSVSTASGRRALTFRRLDRAALARRIGPGILPLYVQQLPGADSATALPRRVPVPPLDEGPHLGYAIQWFSFAVIAVIGYLVLLFRKPGQRAPR